MNKISNDKKGLSEKLLTIDRRILFLIVVFLTSWMLVRPLGLPISVDAKTQKYFDVIDSLPPGSTVYYVSGASAGDWAELGPATVATLKHFLRNELKFILVAFENVGCQLILPDSAFAKIDWGDVEYGVDWVFVGFVEGGITAHSLFAEDFLYAGIDAYGNLLTDLPLFQTVKSVNDCDLFLTSSSGAIPIITSSYDIQTITSTAYINVPLLDVYYKAGVVETYLSGLPGAAQYEYLTNFPALAIASQDALSLTHVFLASLLIVVNAVYILQKVERSEL